MVKKLISGILNKKGSGQDGKPAETTNTEVPDELPPLAEESGSGDASAGVAGPGEVQQQEGGTLATKDDSAVKSDGPDEKLSGAEEENSAVGAGKKPDESGNAQGKDASADAGKPKDEGLDDDDDDVPDELPDINKKKKEEKPVAAVKDAAGAVKAPAEKVKAEGSVIRQNPVEEEASEPKTKGIEGISTGGKASPDFEAELKKHLGEAEETNEMSLAAQKGFFSNLLNHFRKHGVVKDKLLSGNLYSRMSNYWELRKEEITKGDMGPREKRLEQDLIQKLEELQDLEKKWQVQKMALEEDLKFLHQRERDIQGKIEELKVVSHELKFYENVSPESYFTLHNGVIIKNLHELIDALEVIDEETYFHHVNTHRNDFASWIRHTFRDKSLSAKVAQAKNRQEMIAIIEQEGIEEQPEKKEAKFVAKPKDYFWLTNGVAIKDLYELSDALKVMPEETFISHVNEKKNDFSEWVRHAFKNEYLAKKVAGAKTKDEMVELLEIFL